LVALVCLAGHAIAAPPPVVATYPAPPGESLSPDYQVWAADQKVDVYMARVLDPPFAGKEWDHGGPYGFASFGTSGPAVVKIVSRRPLHNVVIRPQRPALKPVLQDDHTLLLNVEPGYKLSIEPEGRRGPLLLFANVERTDPPRVGDPGVIFFGPGIHKPERIVLKSGQTLWLAGGAVVKAEVRVEGSKVLIGGSGILDGSDWEWRKGPFGHLIGVHDSDDVEIEGIILRGSSHWTIVPRNSRRVTIRNVKICNSRVQNDDGINPCNSQDVLISDCFIRSDDDCIALKGLDLRAPNSNTERITVENSILWCDRARVFLLGHESRAPFMRQVTLRNLDIIHFRMTAFLLEPGEDMRLEQIVAEDIRIHGEGQRELIRLKPVVNQYMRKKVPGFIRDVRFRNVSVEGKPGDYLVEVEGADPDHDAHAVTFENVSILGSVLSRDSAPVRIGQHAKHLTFAPGQ
jgi:hypothetical protein